MLDFLKRLRNKHKPSQRPDTADEAVAKWFIIQERKSIRDNELKLIRSTITKQRKETLGAKGLTARERQFVLDALNVIDKHAVDVAFLINRERMQALGAPKQRRNVSHIHGVDMSN